VRPSKIGGYKPRAIAGEHRSWLLRRIREKDCVGWWPSSPPVD
jgi:transposase